MFCFQLYEIDENPKRKEFLDDLFSFMQKRGEFFTFLNLIILKKSLLKNIKILRIKTLNIHKAQLLKYYKNIKFSR